AAVLRRLSKLGRISELRLRYSSGWHESSGRKNGYFRSVWGTPASWGDVILQGPHLFVATPIYKVPNATMRNYRDWSATDFETLAPAAVPVTAYNPAGDPQRYARTYAHWDDGAERRSARDFYRVAWRTMADNMQERTLMPAIIPPGVAHVD